MINYHDVRYKRTLCKNFQTTGQCIMGIRCHFAHGQEEIRNPAIDPLVQYPALALLMQNPAALSSKLIRCKYNDIGACKYGASCHYSHGEPQIQQQILAQQQYQEMLYQNQLHQQQIYQQSSVPQYYYQNQSQMVYQGQPYPQVAQQVITPEQKKTITIYQLQFMIKEINKLNISSEYVAIVQRASEILNVQNIQGCSTLLNEIINRPDCPAEEKKQYEQIINQAQQLAVQLMAQFQNPQPQLQQQQQQQQQQQPQQQI